MLLFYNGSVSIIKMEENHLKLNSGYNGALMLKGYKKKFEISEPSAVYNNQLGI